MPSQTLYKRFSWLLVRLPCMALKRPLTPLFCPLWGVLCCGNYFLVSLYIALKTSVWRFYTH